jgi:hypothetical protein
MRSNNEQDFLEMLEDEDAILVMDNDMCYIRYEDENREGESFDFTNMEVIFILAEKLGIEVERC